MIDNEGILSRPAPDCPLCGSAGALLYQNLRDPLFGSPGVWSLRRCDSPDCASGWIDPLPLPESLGRLYETYHTHGEQRGDNSPLPPIPFAPRFPRTKRLLAALLPRWRHLFQTELHHFAGMTPGTLLDVGCGSGGFLREAVGAGWKAVGIDFDAEAIAEASRVEGAEVHVMDVFDARLDDRRFEGILLDNVIEHLPDLPRVVTRLAMLLAPGGRLVMITPNFQAAGHATFGADWRGLETPRHLCLFTAQSLARLVRENGLPDARAFCVRGPHDLDFMSKASSDIARTRGHAPPSFDLAALKQSVSRSFFTGKTIGEFLILVANKAR
ncbi:MAG: class I SAM-dependent methyltransferase [Sphingobium sp.]|nr:class I SAM-dependent methyltransferase [Sphingobium sp.]